MFSTSTDQTKRVQASGSSYVGGEERGTLCSLPLPTRQNGYKLVVLVMWVVKREEPYTKRVQASGSSYVGVRREEPYVLPLPTRQTGYKLVVLVMVVRREEPYVLYLYLTRQNGYKLVVLVMWVVERTLCFYLYRPDKTVQASGSSLWVVKKNPMFSTSTDQTKRYKLVVLVVWVVKREELYVLYLYRPDKTGTS
ncbi:hypothetical protein J6590_079484 [Homalodisca vitripennis]|nr:hypothetical protein J6590_079484 [Homalodisca vitripennis]